MLLVKPPRMRGARIVIFVADWVHPIIQYLCSTLLMIAAHACTAQMAACPPAWPLGSLPPARSHACATTRLSHRCTLPFLISFLKPVVLLQISGSIALHMQQMPGLTSSVRFQVVEGGSREDLRAAWKAWMEQASECTQRAKSLRSLCKQNAGFYAANSLEKGPAAGVYGQQGTSSCPLVQCADLGAEVVGSSGSCMAVDVEHLAFEHQSCWSIRDVGKWVGHCDQAAARAWKGCTVELQETTLAHHPCRLVSVSLISWQHGAC